MVKIACNGECLQVSVNDVFLSHIDFYADVGQWNDLIQKLLEQAGIPFILTEEME